MFEINAVCRGTSAGRDRDTIAAGLRPKNYNVNYGYQATSWFVLRPGVQLGVLNPPRDSLVVGLGGFISL